MTTTTARRLSESTDSLLRFAMRADAGLSALAGVALAVAAKPLSSVTGFSASTELAIGVGFVLYGVVVFGLAAMPSVRRAGIGVVVANLVYTVAAVGAVLADVWPLTTTGVVLTLASGIYTAIFADLQYLGVRRIKA